LRENRGCRRGIEASVEEEVGKDEEVAKRGE